MVIPVQTAAVAMASPVGFARNHDSCAHGREERPMSAITLLVEEHQRIAGLFDAVSNGDVTAVPLACNALLQHSRMEEEVLYPAVAPYSTDMDWDVEAALEDHLLMRRLIGELGEESSIGPSFLTHAAVLIGLVRDHMREEEDVLFPRLEAALGPQRVAELTVALERAASGRLPAGRAHQDPGASSDGDVSWVDSPVTQSPQVDRSVDAVIQRTHGG
jgi:hemerythrin superfamily protein